KFLLLCLTKRFFVNRYDRFIVDYNVDPRKYILLDQHKIKIGHIFNKKSFSFNIIVAFILNAVPKKQKNKRLGWASSSSNNNNN
ncbi:hypothetical protein RFI_28567, partial [Reticulomyxa filosa]